MAERAPAGGERAAPMAVSVRATAPVERALALARTPITHCDLVAALASTPGATAEKVNGLVTELWRQTILLTDLRPPLTGTNPAGYLCERLAGIPAAGAVAGNLRALLDALWKWDALGMIDRAAAWEDLVQQAVRIHPIRQAATPFQVDMELPLAGGELHAGIGREAAQAAELLLRLSRHPRGLVHLDEYRRAFEARYGLEREVTLLELLDPQFGLGPLPEYSSATDEADRRRSALRQQTLLKMALGANRDRQRTIELGDDLLARLQTWPPELETAPISLELSLFLAAKNTSALDGGDFQIVVGPNLGANSAGRNLGRFADLIGSAASAALAGIAELEGRAARGRLMAELVYLPARLRSANVSIRPAIRDYEIVLGTSPGVPPSRVIPLGELVVAIEEGRFCLRWPRAEGEVVVCAGHMLNSLHAPPVVRFLDEIARDGRVQLGPFDWGAAAGFAFLPRVQRGRIVLAPAQWRLDVTSTAGELPEKSPRLFHDALPAWRERWLVPRHIYLAAADNRLLLDLEAPEQAELLREELRGLAEGRSLRIEEALPGPDDAWLRGPSGGYLTELVVPLARRAGLADESPQGAIRQRGNTSARAAARLRPPGSEWLFLKLYGPASLEDELIAGPVRTFGEFALSAGLAREWFFVRYADPDAHLRLRFRGAPEDLLERLLPQLCAWAGELVAGGVRNRFAFDTYEREVERYGGEEAMSIAESIFAADSAAVAELVWLRQGQMPTLDATTLAALTMDDLLAGFGLSEDERVAWTRDILLSSNDGREYRERKETLRLLLGDPEAVAREPGGAAVAAVLRARRGALAPCAEKLAQLANRGALESPAASLYRSHIHLHANRLLGAGSPIEEMALRLLRRARESLRRAPMGRVDRGTGVSPVNSSRSACEKRSNA